jgi:ribosomal protein S18 acetylase RimI-like enzyme
MDVKIVTATTKLLDKLYEIEKQSFQREAFSKRDIGYLLRDYNSISLAGQVEGEVVAFVIGRMEMEGGTLFGHIFTLETLPAHRRTGIAKKLLYQKLGYKQVSLLEGYYGIAHGLYLKKDLTHKKTE